MCGEALLEVTDLFEASNTSSATRGSPKQHPFSTTSVDLHLSSYTAFLSRLLSRGTPWIVI